MYPRRSHHLTPTFATCTVLAVMLFAAAAHAQHTATLPALAPLPTAPIELSFTEPTSVVEILSAWGEAAGVHVLFDPTLRDRQTTFHIDGTTAAQALHLLTRTHSLFATALDERSVLIAEDTPQMRRTYENQVVRAFPLENIELKDAMTVLRSLLGLKNVAVDEGGGTILMRDTAAKVELAAELLRRLDQPRAEVLVEAELLWLTPDEDSAAERLPQRLGAAEFDRLRRAGVAIARPTLSLLSGEEGQLELIDRLTTRPLPEKLTHYQVGFKMLLGAEVHRTDDEVSLELHLALYDARDDPSLEGAIGPTESRREMASGARLAAGETLIVQGLLSAAESRGSYFAKHFSPDAVPGELVLALTPRIVREPAWAEEDLAALFVGTETSVGTGSLVQVSER